VKVSASNRKGTSAAIGGQGAVLPRKPVLNPDIATIARVYGGVDQITMFVLRPMVKYGIISWAKPMVCTYLVNWLLEKTGIKSEVDNKFDLCQEGVDMYLEHFYYTGNEED